MKNKKIANTPVFLLVALMTLFIACDKDYVSLDSEISGQNNFGVSDTKYEVTAYTNKLNPVQTNGLPSNLLGYYKDLVYGSTTANVVTQLAPTVYDPIFPDEVRVDSVVLTIPYFSKATGITDGVTTYALDSIYGSSAINLKVYENTYFLRSFDPNSQFNSPQKYFSDRSLSASTQIPLTSLRGTVLESITEFTPSNSEIAQKIGEEVTRTAPALRRKMDTEFWNNKIILKEGGSELSNLNNFQNYFRGVYFEAEAINDNGSMMLLNFASSNANITLYYSSPPTGTATERVNGSYKLNFAGNRVNFFENDYSFAIPQGNPTTGDEKLYLKGGQGAMAVIDLFGGTDIDNDLGTITPFEEFKNAYVETDTEGKFVRAKRMINEANLVFFVDPTLTQGQEPDRIYIYDIKNNTTLFDYGFESADKVSPNDSRTNHLGKLKRDGDDKNAQGIKYKIRITEHIKNLLLRDSTNVSLGLAVSTNVNIEDGATPLSILSADNQPVKTVPVSAILSPKGTVLYGNNTTNEDKKLYLEIFYTEPNN
ncbi:DUF4270 domain-containing protein [Gelidibacter salicanalis]|uniref:DUF4270 domain-containing protein n=1 Tax=Gelidibacter salicanalis TaxID=291193 RepID=A0A934NJB3_9FLAO|nr:DUF4270 domain-containing protein [Gelidibacter salicanalis]MBJ7882283.1 DUF4270 domain-containing protein [Gelidibacter salicanalis]